MQYIFWIAYVCMHTPPYLEICHLPLKASLVNISRVHIKLRRPDILKFETTVVLHLLCFDHVPTLPQPSSFFWALGHPLVYPMWIVSPMTLRFIPLAKPASLLQGLKARRMCAEILVPCCESRPRMVEQCM